MTDEIENVAGRSGVPGNSRRRSARLVLHRFVFMCSLLFLTVLWDRLPFFGMWIRVFVSVGACQM